MNPTPDTIAAIRSHVADWTPDDAAIAAALNAPAVANPVAQGTVRRPFTVPDIIGLISSASLANIRSLSAATDIRDKIQANDVAGCLTWAALLHTPPSLVTDAEYSAIVARVTATDPDPAYRALIGWAESAIGREADAQDIAAARPQGS